IWYILVGFIAGIIAKSIMHAHLTIFWTIVLGIIGSIIGGAVTHMFVPPRDQRFHPAGSRTTGRDASHAREDCASDCGRADELILVLLSSVVWLLISDF